MGWNGIELNGKALYFNVLYNFAEVTHSRDDKR